MIKRVVAAVGCAAVFGWAAPATVAETGGQAADYQLDAAHDGFQPDPGFTVPLKRLWSVTEPYATGRYPLIANGAIYTVVGQSLAAISLSTGKTLWQDPNFAPGYAVPGLAYGDGRIYSMTGQQAYDQVNSGQSAGRGVLTAFDAATGAVDWTASLPDEYDFVTPPTVRNGYVYVTGDGENTLLYAISEATGQLAWSQPVDGGDTSPAVTGDGVYLELPCNDAYAFNPVSGALIWHAIPPCSGGGSTISVAAGGAFYGYDGSDAPVILAADSGELLGSFASTDSDPLTAPAVADGYLYTLHGGELSAASENGLGPSAWSFAGNGKLTGSPVVAGTVVYEGSADGTLYGLDAHTGTELWSTTYAHEFTDASLAVGDRELVVASGANLTAYAGTPTPAGASTTPAGASTTPAGASTTPAGATTAPAVQGVPRTGGASSRTSTPGMHRRPAIPSRVYVHERVVARTGVWRPRPAAYRFQWLLCDMKGMRCRAIRRATHRIYRPVGDQVRHRLRVRITALGASGTSRSVRSRASVIRRRGLHRAGRPASTGRWPRARARSAG